MLLQQLEKRLEGIERALPGFIALFDIADCKRRNMHLGHQAVDIDIDAIMLGIAGSARVAYRVRGDVFLGVFKSWEPIESLAKARMERPFVISYRIDATSPSGETRTERKATPAVITRAVRCGWAEADVRNWRTVVARLVDQTPMLDPSLPLELHGPMPPPRKPWSCVDVDTTPDVRCLFCDSTDLEWIDGADDCGDAECRKCAAEVGYRIF